MSKHFLLSSFMFLFLSIPALAQEEKNKEPSPPDFQFPLDCTLDKDCWLMNTPDANGEEGLAQDSFCQNRSYDTHKGVDFAIRNKAAMEDGVNILATASGVVVRLRDGEEDKFSNPQDWEQMKKDQKECGNGVLIRHSNGWFTQYCHLKKESIGVKRGEPIDAGRKIGQIGMSGITQHPHLHVTFIHYNDQMDPFTGKKIGEGCINRKSTPLWNIKPASFALYDAGFSGELPNFDQIPQGNRGTNADDTSAQFLFWTAFLGVETGDVIFMEIRDPKETIFVNRSTTVKEPKARLYQYVGRKLCDGFAEKGLYKGIAKLSRVLPNGETVTQSIERTIEIK